jgi:uncharacterized membrane protein
MTLLVLGLLVFLGVHLVPTMQRLRGSLVARWGDDGYRKRFTVVAVLGLVLIVFGYPASTQRDFLFQPVQAAVKAAPFVVTVALVLFASANLRTHIRRAVRHPMLLGLLLWSVTHLLANGEVRATVLFGSFALYAIVDLASAVSRHAVKAFEPAWKFDAIAVVAGVLIAGLVMHFHASLFGVPAIRPVG